jgi:hypothetical protein
VLKNRKGVRQELKHLKKSFNWVVSVICLPLVFHSHLSDFFFFFLFNNLCFLAVVFVVMMLIFMEVLVEKLKFLFSCC